MMEWINSVIPKCCWWFTVWSQVDITLCQQQCVVTHLVSHTRKVTIGSFAREMAVQLVFLPRRIARCVKTDQTGKKTRGRDRQRGAPQMWRVIWLLWCRPCSPQTHGWKKIMQIRKASFVQLKDNRSWGTPTLTPASVEPVASWLTLLQCSASGLQHVHVRLQIENALSGNRRTYFSKDINILCIVRFKKGCLLKP